MSPVVVREYNKPLWKPVEIVEVGVIPEGQPGQFVLTLMLRGGVTEEWKRVFSGLIQTLEMPSHFKRTAWVAQGNEQAINLLTRDSLEGYVEGVNKHFREDVVPRLESERDQQDRDARFAVEAARRLNSSR